jgi:hypothetical protein
MAYSPFTVEEREGRKVKRRKGFRYEGDAYRFAESIPHDNVQVSKSEPYGWSFNKRNLRIPR